MTPDPTRASRPPGDGRFTNRPGRPAPPAPQRQAWPLIRTGRPAGKTDWFQPGRSRGGPRAQPPAPLSQASTPIPRSENLNGTDQAIHAASHPAPPQPQSVFPPLWTTHRAAENLPAGQDPHKIPTAHTPHQPRANTTRPRVSAGQKPDNWAPAIGLEPITCRLTAGRSAD